MKQTTASGLLQQFAALAASFSQLSVRLAQAAGALQNPGLPPSASLLVELTASRRDFTELCASILAQAESLLVTPLPVPAELASLNDLHPLLQRVVEAEQQRAAGESLRQHALLTLDRVLAIVRRDGSDFPPLLEGQGRARELRSAIAEVAWPHIHPAAEAFTKGEHPFMQLLMLIEGQEELDDDQWALLQDVVEQTFGKPLAIAASRGRLVIPAEYSSTTLPNSQQAGVVVRESASIPLAAPPLVEIALAAAGGAGEAPILIDQPQVAPEPGLEPPTAAVEVRSFPEEAGTQNGAPTSLVEEMETQNGAAAPIPLILEEVIEEPQISPQEEVEKVESQDAIEPQPSLYGFGLEKTAQEIATSVLRGTEEERPAVLRDLMWRLIHEDKVILAFHLARSLETLYPNLQPYLPSWLMRPVVLGRHVRHANGEIARLLEEDFSKFSAECFATSQREWNTAVKFLVAAATLQPVLLAPNTGASTILRTLPMEAKLPQFSTYCHLIVEYGDKREPLDPHVLKKGRGQAGWQADLDALKQAVELWCARAARTTMVFPPATKVWRRWQEPKGLIHSLLQPVRQNDVSKLQTAKRTVEQLSDDAQIKREVEYTDRKVLGRLLGEDIPARALDPLRAQVREAVGFVRRWIDLQEARPDQNPGRGVAQEQAEQLRQQVGSCQEAVVEELNSVRRRNPSILIASATACCRKVVENIRTLLDPQASFPTEEPMPKPFLYTDLLRIPSIRINEQWELEVPDYRPVVDGILGLVANV